MKANIPTRRDSVQQALLKLRDQGMSYREIAAKSGLSVRTLEGYGQGRRARLFGVETRLTRLLTHR